jgi:RNA recognition motif-containing protein
MRSIKTRVPKGTHEKRVLKKRSKSIRSALSNEKLLKHRKEAYIAQPSKSALSCESFEKKTLLESNQSSLHMVIIRNIPYNVEKTDIEEFLSSVMRPTRVIVIKDKQGNSRGFAFAYFNKGDFC